MTTPKTQSPAPQKPAVPFFARKVQRAPLSVRVGVRAGMAEQKVK